MRCARDRSDVSADQPRQEIHVTMPDGSNRKGISWETSPMDVAKEVSKSLSERVVIAKVSGNLEDKITRHVFSGGWPTVGP